MKFTCEKMQLEEAVRLVSKAASPKSPIDALKGILIRAGSDLRLTCYDLRRAIYTDIDADIKDGGSVVVNARLFTDVIRNMPDGLVTVSVNEDFEMLIKCGVTEYTLTTISGDEYPELPEMDRERKLDIPQNILSSMIQDTIFAVSTNESRPVYMGSLFEIENGTMTIVSVDGFRLALRKESIDHGGSDTLRFIVPAYALSDIEKICSDSEETMSLSIGTKHISASVGNTVIITRRLEGDFLSHEKAVPRDFKSKFKINKADLARAIDRVSTILVDGEKKPIKLVFGDGEINLSCRTAVSRSVDSCICEGSAEDVEIGFNDNYLRDALKAINEEEILFCINTGSSPCVIKSAGDDESYLHMVLPVRLSPGN
ncbi:MAG: DNA polymerase III subunit beta [Ruminococcaceae bacterium]|nr:DNA polymerase III subunit beta [Oscillospiraceae bacterium]